MPPLNMNRRNFIGSGAAALASLACAGTGAGFALDNRILSRIDRDSSPLKNPFPPSTYSGIRGFNYTPSTAFNDITFWRDYDEKLVEQELDYARRLGLNSARVFLHYVVYEHDGPTFLRRLKHFVQASHERGISTMPVVWDSCFSEVKPEYDTTLNDWIPNPGVQRLGRDFWPAGERYCEDLVQAIGTEPGLFIWDVMNEPMETNYIWADSPDKAQRVDRVLSFVRHFCELMAKVDAHHPRTVGNSQAAYIKDTADLIDVVTFHDYSPNRQQVRRHLVQGIEAASRLGKPVLVSEVGCLARSNPYDMTLEICGELGLGWHVWELMIGKSLWKDIHGIVYPDGTVRDPSIVAAVQGFFRRRKGERVPSNLDKEGILTRVLNDTGKWLADPAAPYPKGRTLLEEMANLLEAGELVPMNIPPSIQAQSLEEETAANAAEVRRFLEKWRAILMPLATHKT